ncbi:hypothetical protein MC885_004597, partial [Smutsia gigantea]
SPFARKAAPPTGLAASLHSEPRSRNLAPSRCGLGTRGVSGTQGTHVGAGPWQPLWGATACCHPLRSAGALNTELSTTRQGRSEGRQEANAPEWGRAGARLPAHHDLSSSPRRELRGSRDPLPQPGCATQRGSSGSVLGGCGRWIRDPGRATPRAWWH